MQRNSTRDLVVGLFVLVGLGTLAYLSLKVGGSMPNMKCDMGGAAAVLGAFLALVRSGIRDHLYCVLCLAENAVGPDSYRPVGRRTVSARRNSLWLGYSE